MFRVKLESPWPKELAVASDVLISSFIPANSADALLYYWAPPAEDAPQAIPFIWYNCEPVWWFNDIEDGKFRRICEHIGSQRFANHSQSIEELRVPHITHWGNELAMAPAGNRRRNAIAVVSNSGLEPFDLGRRTRFVATRPVHLYGALKMWSGHRRTLFGVKRPPSSYQGDIADDDGKWHGASKRSLMAQYHAAVCLENSIEPFYFTEKFVEAVVAGCIPIYHPHASVSDSFLRGAAWVDPADYDYHPARTVAAALSLGRQEIAETNWRWINSNEYVLASRGERVLARLAAILRSRAQ